MIKKGSYKSRNGQEVKIFRPKSVGGNSWIWIGYVVIENILALSRWDNEGKSLAQIADFDLVFE